MFTTKDKATPRGALIHLFLHPEEQKVADCLIRQPRAPSPSTKIDVCFLYIVNLSSFSLFNIWWHCSELLYSFFNHQKLILKEQCVSVIAISLNLAESIYEVEVNRYQCRVSQNIQLHAGQLLSWSSTQSSSTTIKKFSKIWWFADFSLIIENNVRQRGAREVPFIPCLLGSSLKL